MNLHFPARTRRWLSAALPSLVCLFASVVASAQTTPLPLTCVQGSIASVVRSSAVADLIERIPINCYGGTAGTPVISDISLTFNVPVTSKVVNGISEAILVVGAPAAADQALGTNVFQASSAGVTFHNVSFSASGPDQPLTMYVKNVRVDVHGLGVTETNMFTAVGAITATLQMTNVTVATPSTTVAYIAPPLDATLHVQPGFTAGFPQCTDTNSALLSSPAGSGAQLHMFLRQQERYMEEFRNRSFTTDPTTPAAQTHVDLAYNKDTGYYNPALPAINGLNTAGLASNGDRMVMRFSNVPAGVQVFVTTRPVRASFSQVVLIAADATGNGAYQPVAATGKASLGDGSATTSPTLVDVAPVTLVNGAGTATWEIAYADPLAIETLDFGIALAYTANQPALGTATVTLDYGPFTTVFDNTSSTVPRFVPIGGGYQFYTYSCSAGLPDLAVTSLSAPATATPSATMAVTGTIKNLGPVDSPTFYAEWHLVSPAVPPATTGYEATVGSRCVYGSLAAGQSADCSQSISLYNATPGQYQLKLVADPASLITEASKTNNSQSSPIQITDCSFAVSPTTLNLSATAGGTSVSVTTAAGCSWTSSTTTPWLHVGATATIGSGSATLSLDANTGDARTGTVIVAGQTVTVTQALTSKPTVAITLTYSGAPSATAIVDSVTYTLPHTFNWEPASVHTLSSTNVAGASSTVRYRLAGWSDGVTAFPRTLTVPAVATTYTLQFVTQYKLTFVNSRYGSVATQPVSGVDSNGLDDYFFDSGTVVSFGFFPSMGYNFGSYSGDVTGTNSSAKITMDSPKTVAITLTCDAVWSIASGSSTTVPQPGGTLSLSLITGDTCAWTIATPSWVTVTPASGTGSPSANLSVVIGPNTGAVRQGDLTLFGRTIHLLQPGGSNTLATDIGVFRSSGAGGALWVRDRNGDGLFTGAPDSAVGVGVLGVTGDLPFLGDWSGSGTKKLGIFRPLGSAAPVPGLFLMDYDGSETWNPAVDRVLWFPVQAGDVPVVGHWTGGAQDRLGVFRKGVFYLDVNGNGTFSKVIVLGQAGDIPVIGDWNGDGISKVGVFRNGFWVLDYNGNGAWDGPGVDKAFYLGQAGDQPVVGDWSGDGKTKVGVFRASTSLWVLDYNGNGQWDGLTVDRALFNGFDTSSDTAVVGDWTGDGKAKAGVFHQSTGTWFLDLLGDGGFGRLGFLGQTGDTPIVGKW